MRSAEFIVEGIEDDSMSVKLTGIISQLHGRLKDTATKKPFSLTALINLLRSQGISVSEDQFREMIKNPPLSNLIADVKGNDVIFMGDDNPQSDMENPDQTTDTLEKMSRRASKKRD